MERIENLKLEHEDIERELLELETIMESEEINYANLVHVFKKLLGVWDLHEAKEEELFRLIYIDQIKMPIEQMRLDHKALKGHKDAILRAMNSGNDFEIKKALHVDGRIIIEKLRKHINDEDDILYSVVLDELPEDSVVGKMDKGGFS